jgi:tetratricopeptide (TPR) repeat protein
VKSGGAGGPVESLAGAQAKFSADYNAGRYRDVIADEELLRKYNGLTANAQVVIAQAYYQLGQYKECVSYANSHSGAGADMLKRGGLCAFKAGDDALSLEMAEKLVAVSPTPENWAQLLGQAERAKGLSDAQTVDIYRLKLLTGNMKGADDYFTLAQLLIAARLPAEADQVVQKGQAAKLLVDARAQRLIGLVKQSLATDVANLPKAQAAAQKAPKGDELIKIGEDLTGMGKYSDAVAAIQAGIGKGVKDADNAQVRLAVALASNKQKPAALAALEKAKTTPNGKLVARMWAAFIKAH